jgi:protein-disulfide isomerase
MSSDKRNNKRDNRENKATARERMRAERARDDKRRRIRRQVTVGGSAVAAVGVAAGIAVAVGGGGGSGSVAASNLPLKVPAAAAASDKSGTVITYGDKNAKNTLTLYEDPRCPFCAEFEHANGNTVKHLADEGKFKVEFHMATFLDDALGGKGSKTALNALGAAAQEGPAKFLALHKVLYDNHPDEHNDAFASNSHLLSLASKVPGLRTPAFDHAVKHMTYQPWVNKVTKAFNDSGVQGTPTVMLNGKTLNVLNNQGGSITTKQFTGMIDKQLGMKV